MEVTSCGDICRSSNPLRPKPETMALCVTMFLSGACRRADVRACGREEAGVRARGRVGVCCVCV